VKNVKWTKGVTMADSWWPWAAKAVTDEQLMWRVKMEDDPQAFAALVQRWEKPIQRLGARMMADSHRGEDLAQDAFARLFSRRKDYEPSGRFATFLWRIGLNLCYDELRKRKRRQELALEELGEEFGDAGTSTISSHPSPDIIVAEAEQSETVRRALLELAEPYRVVVVLRHYEGLKFREIADVLGIPEGTVKSRMAEALSQLSRLLSPMNEGEICPIPKPKQMLAI
jgi:RNA polymerase sigma-70 factor (ECF subfamily)